MKLLAKILLIFMSLSAIAEESDCQHMEYKGDPQEVAGFAVGSWEEVSRKTGMNFDRQITILPVKEIDGLTFYGGAINYGEKIDFHTPLNFTVENGTDVAWFLASPGAIEKITVILWYRNEKCHMKVRIPLKHNKSLKAQPSAAGTSPTGAASQHSAGGSAP